jgi:hypothetical protein
MSWPSQQPTAAVTALSLIGREAAIDVIDVIAK